MMPVKFLTAKQRQHYWCYVEELSPKQLALYFHLDDRVTLTQQCNGAEKHKHARQK